MEILFIHQAFPAQFGRLALELAEKHDWTCRFLIEHLSNCPTPTQAMLDRLSIARFDMPPAARDEKPTPWPQIYGKYIELCRAVARSLTAATDWKPDLVVAHGGRGAPSLFLRDIVSCPILNYCEYYFAFDHSDISYRIDLPQATEVAPFYPRCINAPVLAAIAEADGGYSPNEWQKRSFPRRFWPKIEVHFDGIDTELYRPHEAPRSFGGRAIPPGTKVITFAARGLESVRGFDIFCRIAARIAREMPDVLFVVAGADSVYYGWDALFTGDQGFRDWSLNRVEIDRDRMIFLGHVPPEILADLLSQSDLHIYMTVPFVPSWSLAGALASGCVVLASDVAPVREWIEPGQNGLLEPLFDVDRLTESALRVLKDPAAFAPMRRRAREWALENVSLDVCVPRLRDYFERAANNRAGRSN